MNQDYPEFVDCSFVLLTVLCYGAWLGWARFSGPASIAF